MVRFGADGKPLSKGDSEFSWSQNGREEGPGLTALDRGTSGSTVVEETGKPGVVEDGDDEDDNILRQK